jgi:hypothetical protein
VENEDVLKWLDEEDEKDRQERIGDPLQRQLHIEPPQKPQPKTSQKKSKTIGKLPPCPKKEYKDSQDAAQEALKQLFKD